MSVAKENPYFMMELEHIISDVSQYDHSSLDFLASSIDTAMLELCLIQLRDRRKTHGRYMGATQVYPHCMSL